MDPTVRRNDPPLFWLPLLVIGLFAAGSLFGGMREFDGLFGLDTWRGAGPVAFLVSALAMLGLFHPAVAPRVAMSLRLVGTRVPAGTACLAVALLVAFLALPSLRESGDASSIVAQVGAGSINGSSPLTGWLHVLTTDATGLDGREAIRVVAGVSGVVFVLAAVASGRACFPDRERAAAVTAVLLTTGGVSLFFGTLEVYAPVFAACALYVLAGLHAVNGRAAPRTAALVLGVAVSLHGSAIVLLPTLLYTANRGRLRPVNLRGILTAIGWFSLVPAATLSVYLALSGTGEPGSALGGLGQGPFLPFFRTTETILHRYVMFEVEHIVGVLSVLFLASPVGLILSLAGGRKSFDGSDRFLILAAVLLAGLTLSWNVNYDLRRDWELFAIAGLPLAILGPRRFLEPRPGGGPALRVAAVSAFCLLPMVILNATGERDRIAYAFRLTTAFRVAEAESEGGRAERNRRAAERWDLTSRRLDRADTAGTFARAGQLAGRGAFAEAEALYREILRTSPDDAQTMAGLGVAIYRSGRRTEGTAVLTDALRRDPRMLHVRLNLARIALANGEEDRAESLLKSGLRISGIHPLAPEALDLLAELWRRRGKEAEAETLEELARRRRDQSGA